MKRRKYTADFKRKVVLEAMRGDETVRSIAARHGVNPKHSGFLALNADEASYSMPIPSFAGLLLSEPLPE